MHTTRMTAFDVCRPQLMVVASEIKFRVMAVVLIDIDFIGVWPKSRPGPGKTT